MLHPRRGASETATPLRRRRGAAAACKHMLLVLMRGALRLRLLLVRTSSTKTKALRRLLLLSLVPHQEPEAQRVARQPIRLPVALRLRLILQRRAVLLDVHNRRRSRRE